MNVNSLKLPEAALKKKTSIIIIQIEQPCFAGILVFVKMPSACDF